MYYDVTENGLGDLTFEEFKKADDEQKVVEIWNDVFMQYLKKDGKVVGKLEKQNVDTGAGLERFTMVLQKKSNIFETDLFAPIVAVIRSEAKLPDKDDNSFYNMLRAERIVADHVRATVFMLADGVLPSNTDQGYILRRLIRRAVRYANSLEMSDRSLERVAQAVIEKYGQVYGNLEKSEDKVIHELGAEVKKFNETLERGMKEFEKGIDAFILFTSYGFPFELTKELAAEKGIKIDEEEFMSKMKHHQDLSRSGSEQKFKGGLADTSEQTTKYHTATHMLNAALRQVLGDHVSQRGSNITAERLRFDFSHSEKMTDEQKKKVEEIVNEKIKEDLPVSFEEMSVDEAKAGGAIGVFGEKYAEKVKVYTIGSSTGSEPPFSREICGGPHVTRTGAMGHFKILKEEAVSAGVRRIKAILE
jgi:alanyl-tRNA synthetase